MRYLLRKLDDMKYKNVIWLLALSEILHNTEEAIWLPSWSVNAGIWHPPVDVFEFRFAVAVVTLVFVLVLWYYACNDSIVGKHLMAGALTVIALNVVFPHLLATLCTGNYAPGLASGALFNLPVCVYLLVRGIREDRFNAGTLVKGTIAMLAILLPLMALSFRLADTLGAFV